jgi:hypothetical protein
MKDTYATGKPLALKREHPALHFTNFSIFVWAVFALLVPDPDAADEYQCGSTTLEKTRFFSLFFK